MMNARWTVAILAAGASLAWPAFAQQSDETERLKKLVERIARGDEVESRGATAELVERVVNPLGEALGSLERRPDGQERGADEIVRLRGAIAHVFSAVRVKLFRASLPPEDRKLFDEFTAQYGELTHQLFQDNEAVRMAALQSIPLEPNTGAGVAICARVDDESDEVAMAALDLAKDLHDPVVARGLRRYVRDATITVRSGFYGAAERDIAETVGIIVHKAILAIAAAQDKESATAVAEAFAYFAAPGPGRWHTFLVTDAARALGGLADERSAALLLGFLDDTRIADMRSGGPAQLANQTVGDAALLGLVRIFGLKPESFGLVQIGEGSDFYGYADDKARQDGHRRFRIWYEQNGGKSREQRQQPATPPASAPAANPKEPSQP